MEKFEIMPHTADLEIRVWGEDRKELFLNAFLAMSEALKAEAEEGGVKRRIKIKSSDFESLLVDFLSEVLYLVQAKGEIYKKIIFQKFSEKEIEAEIFGKKAERFGEDIKAVTYHNLNIRQKEDGIWEATILFDV